MSAHIEFYAQGMERFPIGGTAMPKRMKQLTLEFGAVGSGFILSPGNPVSCVPIAGPTALFCLWCRKPFTPKRPHRMAVAKFCSHRCSYEHKRNPEWAWLAFSLAMFGDYGFKDCAKALSISRSEAYGFYKRNGLLGGRKPNVWKLQKPPKKEADAKRLVMLAYAEESRKTKKYDESFHWSNHPELRKYRRTISGFELASRIEWRRCRDGRTNYYIAKALRSRLYAVLKGIKKSKPTLALLGCSLGDFRLHLERMFRPGMTWHNHGAVWHIDHIKPCASFDLSRADQQAQCFHWSNMQPLFASENLSKSDSTTWKRPNHSDTNYLSNFFLSSKNSRSDVVAFSANCPEKS